MADDAAPANPKSTESASSQAQSYDLSKSMDVRALAKQDDDTIRDNVYSYIGKLAASVGNYQVLFLVDTIDSISSYHANRLYEAASDGNSEKDILLVLQSEGGKIEPAYLLSKTLKRLSKQRFIVVAPRQAKSAATLLALGADEVHMGLMSQLGPIDPQISGLPALGLANALRKVTEIASQYPASAEMWASYLDKTLYLPHVGYFERLCESAAQYAQRLLQGKQLPPSWTPDKLADHFVHHYKDHSFVVDLEEAKSLLGEKFIRTSSTEYQFGNEVIKTLDLLDTFLFLNGRQFYYVGPLGSGLIVQKRKQ